jgi:hypothetical protein
MDKNTMIAFLRAKVNVGAGREPHAEGVVMSRSQELIVRSVEAGQMPVSALTDLDRELDNFHRVGRGRKEIDAMRAKLVAAFGFASLSETPEKVIQRVLKRGSIRDVEEARIVRDHLSDASPEKDFHKLDSLLAGWERTQPRE